MKRFCLTVLVVTVLAVHWPAQPNQRPSYNELVDSVWQTINDNSYDPSFGGADWKAIRQKYVPRQITQVKDDAAFIDLACRMMRELHASHLELVPLQAPQAGIGVRISRRDGKNVITTVAMASDAPKQGLRIGDVLLDQPGQLTGQIGTPATVHVQGCDGRNLTLEVKRENPWWPPEHPSLR